MVKKKCGILVPRIEALMRLEGNDYGECLRTDGHFADEHIFRNSEGAYIGWEWDYECNCCEPDEYERCFIYRDIPEEEALELIAKPRETSD